MDLRDQAIAIFRSGVESVLPGKLIANFIKLDNNILICNNLAFDLNDFENVYLTGFGKASAAMAKAMEELLGNRVSGGFILTKYGHGSVLKKTVIREAGHPVPDSNGLKGTSEIVRMVQHASDHDLLIVLISGGGSSLLTDLPEDITLEDLIATNRLLILSGADIGEINAVRKHLSCLKGGQLARLAYPATVLALLISDVVGDPTDVIASGPTVPDCSSFQEAWDALDHYDLLEAVPVRVKGHLQKGMAGLHPETVREGDPLLEKTTTVVLGNNATALESCASKAAEMGFDAVILSGKVTGDVNEVADYIYSQMVPYMSEPQKGKTALLFGGEPTVRPTGNGQGGRNQHLALLMASKIEGIKGVTFLSAGTDGTDGPTDATGAVCDGETVSRSQKAGLDIISARNHFDSYPFFEREGGLIKTGPTFTNVMDVMIVLIDK